MKKDDTVKVPYLVLIFLLVNVIVLVFYGVFMLMNSGEKTICDSKLNTSNNTLEVSGAYLTHEINENSTYRRIVNITKENYYNNMSNYINYTYISNYINRTPCTSPDEECFNKTNKFEYNNNYYPRDSYLILWGEREYMIGTLVQNSSRGYDYEVIKDIVEYQGR